MSDEPSKFNAGTVSFRLAVWMLSAQGVLFLMTRLPRRRLPEILRQLEIILFNVALLSFLAIPFALLLGIVGQFQGNHQRQRGGLGIALTVLSFYFGYLAQKALWVQ